MEQLQIKAKIQVQKPVAEVFDAIVDPAKMSNYFIASGSERLETGKQVTWTWPEFEGEFPVKVVAVEPHHFISFYWAGESRELLVEIKLESRENDSTLVTVTEKDMPNNEAGIKWLGQNSEGWANFLACLKAYLEYGINLRKGAFDFMRK
jgi:uncharacterized protein YndB with AHSA1/START domain